jgi:sugar lactone lactonase YvrE
MRRLATLPRGGGSLSGLALDAQGGVWTTQRDGWSLARFDAERSLDLMIGPPVSSHRPTLRRQRGATLGITSSRQEPKLRVLGGASDSGCLPQLEAEVAGQLVKASCWRLDS